MQLHNIPPELDPICIQLAGIYKRLWVIIADARLPLPDAKLALLLTPKLINYK